MVYQTTPGLDPRIADEGCYFRVGLRIYEIKAKKKLTVKEVNQVFEICLEQEYVGNEISDLYMISGAVSGIAQVASGLFQRHVYMRRVMDENKCNFKIGKYTRTTSRGKNVTHFVLEAGPENQFFDPYSPEGSRTYREGKFDSFRFIYAEAI